MRTLERIPFSLGDTTKRALGGVALTLALLGVGDIYNSQPAEAQTLGEETDSEYAPDCWHGHYPVWITDKNSDGQPGPRPSEFKCRPLPGCTRVDLMPGDIMRAFERAGIISPPLFAFGGRNAWAGYCQGEPWPEFEDYREHLDAYPWIEENIERILAIPLWHSDEIKDGLDAWTRNTWWWKRVYGQDTPDTETSESQPTTETTSESTTDQGITEITDTATEPDASPEAETTTDTSETQPTTSESTTDQGTTEITDIATEPEPSPEAETTTDTSETQPTTETTSEPTTDQGTTDITDTATEPEPSPEAETTTDTSETQPTTETTSEPTTDQGTTDITDTATEPEPSPEAETTTDTSEVLIQDGYLNRNKIAIFAGGTAILAVLGIATWRRKKVS